DRARERGKVEDEVDGLGELDVLGDVVVQELEVAPEVLDVHERARDEVVDADHAMPALDKVLAEVRAEEARASRHDRGRHLRDGSQSTSGSTRSAQGATECSSSTRARRSAPAPPA